MITQNSLEQILDVISSFKSYILLGNSLSTSRQQATKNVAIKNKVTYQTIGDLCRRRLNLTTTEDFNVLLKKIIEGNSGELMDLLILSTHPTQHGTIREYFHNLKMPRLSLNNGNDKIQTHEIIEIELPFESARLIKAYAELKGATVSIVINNIIVPIIKTKMKDFVDSI